MFGPDAKLDINVFTTFIFFGISLALAVKPSKRFTDLFFVFSFLDKFWRFFLQTMQIMWLNAQRNKPPIIILKRCKNYRENFDEITWALAFSEINFVQDPLRTLVGAWPCLGGGWMDHILQVIIIININTIITFIIIIIIILNLIPIQLNYRCKLTGKISVRSLWFGLGWQWWGFSYDNFDY